FHDLRWLLPECRPGGAGLHHQSVLASSDKRKPAIPVQFLPRAYRGKRAALPARLQGRTPPVGRHRENLRPGAEPTHSLELYEHRWRVEGTPASLGTRRTVRLPFRQRRRHAVVLALPDLQLPRLERCAGSVGAVAVLRFAPRVK